MATPSRSLTKDPSRTLSGCKISKPLFASALLVLDSILVALIIAYVPYTKIDWDAYMSQVDGFLGGERHYTKLKGDTGPLLYPAGFLYVYSAIKFLTGGEVFPAQILFGILYIINLGIIFFVYIKTDLLPWWALALLCLSKRVHSIFILRLFIDCFAMTLLHASLALLLCQQWHLALTIFSGAVSIKMNALDVKGVFSALFGAALVQYLRTSDGLRRDFFISASQKSAMPFQSSLFSDFSLVNQESDISTKNILQLLRLLGISLALYVLDLFITSSIHGLFCLLAWSTAGIFILQIHTLHSCYSVYICSYCGVFGLPQLKIQHINCSNKQNNQQLKKPK
ncbi:ALG3 protein [Musa troglodytarum]|uniref:dolichyl-P-Man:Man5GlcNAc2-PP-dolichol alpha-1,3-mannosyltransferase n=1 Tax=Musa troglodytarum TaxID=320322 RepID=A0A9E7EAY8_9LILI|nr:ALG3 protein [Musa troglodytarum]